METYNTIEDQLTEMQHIDIKKQKFCAKKYVIGTVGSSALFVLYFLHLIPSHFLNNTLLFVGTVILSWCLVKWMVGKTKKHDDYIYEPTGKKLKKHLLYFDGKNIQKLYDLFEKKEYAKIPSLEKVTTSGHILKVLGTDDGNIMVLQVLEYIPYDYVPSTDVVILKGQEAHSILQMVKAS